MPKDKDSIDIYYRDWLSRYLDRPKAFEKLLYEEYASKVYEKTINDKSDYADNNDSTYVYLGKNREAKERTRKEAVPVFYRYGMTGTSREMYFLQLLLRRLPFNRDQFNNIFSESNKTKTYHEECIVRNIIDPTDMYEEAIIYLESCKRQAFDINYLTKIAKELVACNFIDNDQVATLLQTVAPNHDRAQKALWANVLADPNIDPVPDMKDIAKKLSASQLQAFDYITNAINKHANSKDISNGLGQALAIISGGAGSGKSFLIRCLIQWFIKMGLSYKICAPTGTAAKLIGGETVHAAFKLDMNCKSSIEMGSNAAYFISELEVIIIDEYSMLQYELLHEVMKLCRKHAGQNNRHLPFGGKSVILFGDCYQVTIGRTR